MIPNHKENEAVSEPPSHSSVFDKKKKQDIFISQATIWFSLVWSTGEGSHQHGSEYLTKLDLQVVSVLDFK